jgi:hypothetical protein
MCVLCSLWISWVLPQSNKVFEFRKVWCNSINKSAINVSLSAEEEGDKNGTFQFIANPKLCFVTFYLTVLVTTLGLEPLTFR